MPDASLPAAERVTENNATAVTEVPLPAAPEATKPQAQKTETNKLQDKTIEQAPVVKPDSLKVATLNTGLVKVKLVFTGPSWISVQDKTGQTVFSKLSKAGTEEFVEGVPPLKFHIGDVSATQIIFNGQSVDLTPNTYNNMARITLGDH
jgi:cytoskeleton protein RodZ